jgi:hypothetical protein
VTARLKAPSTAKFPSCFWGEYRIVVEQRKSGFTATLMRRTALEVRVLCVVGIGGRRAKP